MVNIYTVDKIVAVICHGVFPMCAEKINEMQRRLDTAYDQAQLAHGYTEERLQKQSMDSMRQEEVWAAQTSSLES